MSNVTSQAGRPIRRDEVPQPVVFLSDVQTLRARARKHIEEGAVTGDYGQNMKAAVKVLNDALSTELVCTLRYRQLGGRPSSIPTGLRSCRMPNTEPATRWRR